jgi:hypothetical protein
VGQASYVNRKLWPCDKPEQVAEGFFDGFVVDLGGE